ncbi:hypothetical protein D9758_005847 [Tetrapyrgos nigripes]|uniref:NAD-dependent epimerase/dehydratase domain-containing protein n=1 Tax=Tetrapyrgos nigripes TaxID=182062 RepID=A0A8H5LHH6_9AGAR|nr:hypothetical protein D9758_005847 [Tetrapyrgos nigripes]
MAPLTVAITGASGFVGSHILKAALNQGYNTVAISRGAKAAYIKKASSKYGERLRVVEVDNIFTGKIDKEVFKGVDALIHVATPLASKGTPFEEVIPNAINGTLNIVQQAADAGVKSIVLTGSLAAVWNPERSFKPDDWNPITIEKALDSKNPMVLYEANKKYSELAVWEWAEKHPEVEVTFILPPMCFGPYEHEFYDVREDNLSLSIQFMYSFIYPDAQYPVFLLHTDVRDLALAHLNALKAPPTSAIGRKRVFFASPHDLDYKDVFALLAEKRPQLKERFNKREPPVPPLTRVPCDFKRIEEVTGFKPEDMRTVEQTLLDLYDDCLMLEEKWKAEGRDASKLPGSIANIHPV